MIHIGILLFHQVEELDFVAPFEVLSYMNKLHPGSTKISLLAETMEPIHAYNGMRVLPDCTFSACSALDILVVPGGKGRHAAMDNECLRTFILSQAPTARYVTSICTGAFILATAGLLTGRKATTHHDALNELSTYPIYIVHNKKIVHDENIITAAGITSGLELGFYLIRLLFGAKFVQEIADKIEYKPDLDAL